MGNIHIMLSMLLNSTYISPFFREKNLKCIIYITCTNKGGGTLKLVHLDAFNLFFSPLNFLDFLQVYVLPLGGWEAGS